VANELTRLTIYRNLTVVPIYGGAPMGRQIEQLKSGAHIVAGTPGRVLDHLRRGTLQVDALRLLVLDECDEMLSMGFQEDIDAICDRLPKERQGLLFSATIPEEIERVGRRYLRNPEKILLSAEGVGAVEVEHSYYLVSGLQRVNDLIRVLELESPDSAIIFCNTRDETGSVARSLQRAGLDAEAISSDLTQSERERVMGRMRKRDLRYLVATDIAARGIDISDLSHVINYTFPESLEVYIHRTGRTGRAGKQGIAISLISPRELGNFYYLKLTYKIRPDEKHLPTDAELATRREAERMAQVQRAMASEPGEQWRALARRLATLADSERYVAALLECYFATTDKARGTSGAKLPSVSVQPPGGISSAAAASTAAAAPSAVERPLREGGRERRNGRPRDDGRSLKRESRPPRLTETPAVAAAEVAQVPSTVAAPRPVAAPAQHSTPTPSRRAERDFWETWVEAKRRSEAASGPVGPAAPAVRPVVVEAPRPSASVLPGSEPTEPSESAESTESTATDEPPGWTRLYLNLGRKDGVRAADLQTLLTERAGLAAADVQRLSLRPTHAHVSVPESRALEVIEKLAGLTSGARTLVCERAKPRVPRA
jgi:ATP-dependent RNA helicase DeaD